jgi:hypothetical protein
MRIELSDIHPNPHRGLTRGWAPKGYPIDQDHVEALRESIRSYGFWGGIACRRSPTHPGKFEIAQGHHRLLALRAEKVSHIEMSVQKLTDAEMLEHMVAENALQRGATTESLMQTITSTTESLMQTITSVAHEIMNAVLRSDNIAHMCEEWSLTEKQAETIIGRVENGDFGWKTIQMRLNAMRINVPISKRQASAAATAFRASEAYAALMSPMEEHLRQKAEQARKDAEAADPHSTERRTAQRRAETAEKKAKKPKAKQPKVSNSATSLFDDPVKAERFVMSMRTELAQQVFTTPEAQRAVAQHIITRSKAEKVDPNQESISDAKLREMSKHVDREQIVERTHHLVMKAAGYMKDLSGAQKREVERKDVQLRIRNREKDVTSAMSKMVSAVAALDKELKNHPGETSRIPARFDENSEMIIRGLNTLRSRYGLWSYDIEGGK